MQIRPIWVDYLEIVWQLESRAIKLPVSYFENRPKLEMNFFIQNRPCFIYENDFLCVYIITQ